MGHTIGLVGTHGENGNGRSASEAVANLITDDDDDDDDDDDVLI